MLERLFQRHLEDDEPLYLVVHKHWIFSFRSVVAPVLALVATWVLLYFAPIRPVVLGVLFLDIALFVWLLRRFLDEYMDALLITDRAILDVEWHGFFHRESTRIDYAAIEGVSTEIEGVLGTFLNYGTLTVERVGSGSVVEIERVRKPRDIQSAILACQAANIRTRNLKDSAAIKDLLSEIVAERMQMRTWEKETPPEEENEEECISS